MANENLCCGCRAKPAVCVAYVGKAGTEGHPEGMANRLCDDCCGHGCEDVRCYHIATGVPMDEFSAEEGA